MLNVSVFCIFASYLVAFCFELTRLRGQSLVARIVSLGFASAGLLAHTIYLLARSSEEHLPPLLSSSHDWLLVLAWLLMVLYLVLTIVDRQLAIGLVSLPLIIGLVATSWLLPDTASRGWDPLRSWAMLHASSLVLGTAAVLIGFVLSLLFLWQNGRLKQGAVAKRGLSLPSLEQLARLNLWSLSAAVPLLSFGIISGIVLTYWTAERVWNDPVVLGGTIGWAAMCTLLIWQLSQTRTPGRKVAIATAWSCGLLLFAYVGLQVLASAAGMDSVHGRKPTDPKERAAPAALLQAVPIGEVVE